MIPISVRTKSGKTVDIDELPDKELEEFFENKTDVEGLRRWCIMIVKWVRTCGKIEEVNP